MNSNLEWQDIRKRAVGRLYPSEEDLRQLEEAYERYADFIRGEGFDTFFAGSAGRGTCMKGDRDIDLFVLFPETVEREELESKGLELGRKLFEEFNGEYEVEYAEHPYTKGVIDGTEVEVVPCIDTDPEDIRSAVDRSPHHAKWVRDNLSQRQREDVVLLKAFLRASEIYGSSLKVRGFSGYLCEILIHEFDTLENLLEKASEWGQREVIDPEDHHGELPEELEEKFNEASLVVIDPVDSERNVASVLTMENYARFIFEAWRFTESPGLNFFQEEEIELDRFALKKEVEARGDFIAFEFTVPERPDDIIYPQLRKTMRRLEAVLRDHGFRVFDSGFHVSDTVKVFFELQSSLPGIAYQKGPSVFHGSDHIEQFTGKYDNVFVEDDRLVARTERDYTDARELVKDFLDGEASQLEEKGVPGNVAERIKDFNLIDVMSDDEEWLKFLSRKLRIQ